MKFGFEAILCVVIAAVMGLNWLQTARKWRWHLMLHVLSLVAALTLLIGAGQRWLAPRSPEPVAALLNALDRRHRKCETVRLVCRNLAEQLRSLPHVPVRCRDITRYVDLPRAVIRLPAAALALTSAGTLEALKALLTEATKRQCADDQTVFPADIAKELDSAAAECKD